MASRLGIEIVPETEADEDYNGHSFSKYAGIRAQKHGFDFNFDNEQLRMHKMINSNSNELIMPNE